MGGRIILSFYLSLWFRYRLRCISHGLVVATPTGSHEKVSLSFSQVVLCRVQCRHCSSRRAPLVLAKLLFALFHPWVGRLQPGPSSIWRWAGEKKSKAGQKHKHKNKHKPSGCCWVLPSHLLRGQLTAQDVRLPPKLPEGSSPPPRL